MAIFDEKSKKHLKEILAKMKGEIDIAYFSQEFECPSCRDTRMFLEEFASISGGKINLFTYDLVRDKEKVEKYGVSKIPAIVLIDKFGKNTRIKFYGVPAGYEINSFLDAVFEVSGSVEKLPETIEKKISSIKSKVDIQVFVSLGCPYCPTSVIAGNKIALRNENVTSSMVETTVFPHLANKYNVQSVPKIVINEKYELIGAHPIENILDTIEKEIK